ncbi:MAG: ABC transporter substrate-binding protein [Comamonadaceae bacterium]|nr:ABC transporter substrate-binding protein [Comamonadaceae bacterium]
MAADRAADRGASSCGQGVKFHDGTPFTADDVVFSIEPRQGADLADQRLRQRGRQAAARSTTLTVEFRLRQVNPIFLRAPATPLCIMSKAWCEKNKVTKPLDFKNKEESYAALNANGTGPYMLVSRAAGHQDRLQAQPELVGHEFEGNVQEIVYTPIGNDATRAGGAGLRRDRLRARPGAARRRRGCAAPPGVKVIDGPENRIVFIGMDQSRDELLYGSVKGKNPFKDVRVRQRAVPRGRHRDDQDQADERPEPAHRRHHAVARWARTATRRSRSACPFDLAKARAADGRGRLRRTASRCTLDCPNNRYINDEEICIALAAMWAQDRRQGQGQRDAARDLLPEAREVRHQPVHARLGRRRHRRRDHAHAGAAQPRRASGVGYCTTTAACSNDKFDALAAQVERRGRPGQARGPDRQAALREYKEQVHLIPLHRQVIPLGGAHQRRRRAPRRTTGSRWPGYR